MLETLIEEAVAPDYQSRRTHRLTIFAWGNQKAMVSLRPINAKLSYAIEADWDGITCIGEAANRFPECVPAVQSRENILS